MPRTTPLFATLQLPSAHPLRKRVRALDVPQCVIARHLGVTDTVLSRFLRGHVKNAELETRLRALLKEYATSQAQR